MVRPRFGGCRRHLLPLMLFSLACGGDVGGVEDVDTTAATNLILDDVTNFGDGRDLALRFVAAPDEAAIREYRILIVKAASAAGFALPAADAVSADRYTVVAVGSSQHVVTLAATAVDVAGESIVEGVTYVAFVLSAGTDAASSNALSAPSNAIPVASTTVKVTYLGNAGVLISDDTHAVVMDGLSGNLSGWIQLSANEFTSLTRGDAPFEGIDLVFATHSHGDHFSPTAVNTFLGRNSNARYIAPPQAVSGVSAGGQIVNMSPDRGTRVDMTVNDVPLSVLHLRHFDQFGNDFSSVENYGFIVELGGKKLLHLGDVEYSSANLDAFDLELEDIDVVILPMFNTLLSSQNADLIKSLVAPGHVIVLHFQASQVENESSQALSLYDSVTAFTEALQFVRF